MVPMKLCLLEPNRTDTIHTANIHIQLRKLRNQLLSTQTFLTVKGANTDEDVVAKSLNAPSAEPRLMHHAVSEPNIDTANCYVVIINHCFGFM